MSQFIPVAICFAISLVFGNKAYIFLSVSFIQVIYIILYYTSIKTLITNYCFPYFFSPFTITHSIISLKMLKAGTPVIVLVLSTIFGLESPTLTEIFIVFMIAAGVSITSVGELRFSWSGIAKL